MKRPVALALTIAIFAAIAVCFLRPGDLNPDFGGVPEVCTITSATAITDCTGDTDIMVAEEVQWLRSGPRGIIIRMRASKDVFLTSARFVDGTVLNSGNEPSSGIIEKVSDGEWRKISDLTPHWADVFETSLGLVTTPYSFVPGLLSDDNPRYDGMINTFRIPIFEYEPGATYRFTYYFREMVREYPRESGEELYSITHTVTVPEATNKRFDLVNLGIDPIEWIDSDEDGAVSGSIYPMIRVNKGDAPCFDFLATKFEVRDGIGWTGAKRDNGRDALVFYGLPEQADLVQPLYPTKFDGYYEIQMPQIYLYVSDISVDHRLILVFTEHPDGSGEQYTLTLKLRFDE